MDRGRDYLLNRQISGRVCGMKHKQKKKLSDQLRAAIDASDMTRYRIAVKAGIGHATLSRFMNGKAGLSVESMDRLGEILDLAIVERNQLKRH